MYTGAAARPVTNNFQQSQDTLYALAGDTGGKALLDNNDLDRGIVQAQQRSRTTTSRLLHHQHREERPLPPHQDFARAERWTPSSITARATTPTRNSANSPPSTRSASLKMR